MAIAFSPLRLEEEQAMTSELISLLVRMLPKSCTSHLASRLIYRRNLDFLSSFRFYLFLVTILHQKNFLILAKYEIFVRK
jgi:hypothetical protein